MRSLILIAFSLAVINTAQAQQYYDPNVALQLQRQADELTNLRTQQNWQYREMQERQERQDYDDRMRRLYPNWGR